MKQTKAKRPPMYSLISEPDTVLTPYYERWYRNGKEVLPTDFDPTPTTTRYMYYGSGENTGKQIVLTLSTLSREDNQRFADMLGKLGFVFILEAKGKKLVASGVANCNSFLDYMGEPVMDCYRDKFKRLVGDTKLNQRVGYLQTSHSPTA